jgi:hypothetical protein
MKPVQIFKGSIYPTQEEDTVFFCVNKPALGISVPEKTVGVTGKTGSLPAKHCANKNPWIETLNLKIALYENSANLLSCQAVQPTAIRY